MTDREKAIVMAYTGISMLSGDKLNEFYKYLSELYGRPVYTHEIITLDMEHKSKPDFLKLCEKEQPERKRGKWQWLSSTYDRVPCEMRFRCSECHHETICHNNNMSEPWEHFCPNCGADMREGGAE